MDRVGDGGGNRLALGLGLGLGLGLELPQWLDTLAAMRRESGLRAVEIVMRYAVWVESGPPTPQLQRLLAERVGPQAVEVMMSWAEKLLEEGRQQGREEGQQEGRLAGLRTALVRMVERRFGAVPPSVRAAVAAGDEDQLQAWMDRLLVAESPEDVVR